MLVQAARVATRTDPRMMELYQRVASRKGTGKAAVRVANKMAVIIWHMLTERLAKVILVKASEMRLTHGRAPQGIAAACVYISSQLTDEHRTQSEIARTAKVTEVTIRNRYKELAQRMEFNIQL